jgi:hypothetical protein
VPPSRPGRIVTSVWRDLALAGMRLPAGTVIDGEAVIGNRGGSTSGPRSPRPDRRSRGRPPWRRNFPPRTPRGTPLFTPRSAAYGPRPYSERWHLLLEVLDPSVGRSDLCRPPTTTTRRCWSESLQAQGNEGIVAKRATSACRPGGTRQKIRHSETTGLPVVGCTGGVTGPRALAVRSPGGSTRSPSGSPPLWRRAATWYRPGPGPRRRIRDGRPSPAPPPTSSSRVWPAAPATPSSLSLASGRGSSLTDHERRGAGDRGNSVRARAVVADGADRGSPV